MKRLVTERDVLEAWKQRRTKIPVAADALVTPAATDAAKLRKIEIVRKSPASIEIPAQSAVSRPRRIILGSDHGGFELKNILISFLEERGHAIEDVGTFSTGSVDYPDYAHLVAQKVAQDETVVGIIIDGAGIGSAMTANKVPGIRAAACYDSYTARNSREHNFANILTLGSRVTGIDLAKEIVAVWLETDYGAERHRRRVDKIMQIEEQYRAL